jgi:hypothetical protein
MGDDSKVMQVIQFTGCTEEVARNTLESENWNVVDAIDHLTTVPTISGNKYIPSTPTINDQLSPDVREKIKEARKLADLFTFAPRNDLRGKASHYPSQESPAQKTE